MEAVTALPFAYVTRADISFRRGEWPSAMAEAHRARELSFDIGLEVEQAAALRTIARVEAFNGDADLCRDALARAEAIVKRSTAPVVNPRAPRD